MTPVKILPKKIITSNRLVEIFKCFDPDFSGKSFFLVNISKFMLTHVLPVHKS